MTNEAAERLLIQIQDIQGPLLSSRLMPMIEQALAAERRATVERIRAAIKGRGFSPISEADQEWIGWRLDEEAAR